MNSTGVTRRAISHRGTVTTGCQRDRPWCHCDAKIDMTWILGRTSRTGMLKVVPSCPAASVSFRVQMIGHEMCSFIWSGATAAVCLSDRWHHAKSFLWIWKCVCTLALSWWQNNAPCSHFSLFHLSSSGFPSFPSTCTFPFLCTRPLFSHVCKHLLWFSDLHTWEKWKLLVGKLSSVVALRPIGSGAEDVSAAPLVENLNLYSEVPPLHMTYPPTLRLLHTALT